MTQNEEILQLLKERGPQGINSFERLNGGIYAAQLPRCINDLKKMGHMISVSQLKRDRSVNYYLSDQVKGNKPLKSEPRRLNRVITDSDCYKDEKGRDFARL